MPDFPLSLVAKISIGTILLIGLFLILYFVSKDKLRIEISILWIFSFIIGLIFTIFDDLLLHFTHLIGGVQPSSGLSVLSFGFVFLLLIFFSSIISKLLDKVKNLIQYVSFLEKRVRELEDKLKEDEKD